MTSETVLAIFAAVVFVAYYILFDRVGDLEEEIRYLNKERKSDKTKDLIDRIERIVSAKLFSNTDSGM